MEKTSLQPLIACDLRMVEDSDNVWEASMRLYGAPLADVLFSYLPCRELGSKEDILAEMQELSKTYSETVYQMWGQPMPRCRREPFQVGNILLLDEEDALIVHDLERLCEPGILHHTVGRLMSTFHRQTGLPADYFVYYGNRRAYDLDDDLFPVFKREGLSTFYCVDQLNGRDPAEYLAVRSWAARTDPSKEHIVAERARLVE